MTNKIEDVVLKIMTDHAFAERLLANPEAVLHEEGVEPTTEILQVLAGLNLADLRTMAEKFNNEGIAM